MGSVAKRPNGRWRARYRAPDGAWRAKHFTRKVDAERFVATIETAKLRGAYIDPDDRTTVAEYARRWAAARPYRATTARRVEAQIRCHLEGKALGGRRLAAVLPSDVQAWSAELAQTMAPATVQLQVNLLKAVYASAVLDRLVASSPVVRIALPRAERDRVVPLTIDQVQALAREVPERCSAMVVVQAALGLRVGELLALRDQDVNFLGRSVRIEHQLERGTRRRVPPKTPRSRRAVPLPQVAAEALSEHMRNWPALDDGTLFYGASGRPYDHAYYGTKVFTAAARRLAGAKGSTFPPEVTTHDLRHHYASVLLAGGESVVAVAERLGHDNAGMVLRVYGHLMPDSEDHTRRVIDAAWAPLDGAARVSTGGSGRDGSGTPAGVRP
ncbi:tyrosine-type recombinase/integrase [Pseudonocardia hydrocarbonoxydans]|uniref:Site-specific integrase n=1 Tax=Pseudonocardia hydrocarbonoxydans TaxID=76726 RepID=A0A4Y3WSS3_9PSEU|nr:site-specific integrase [Pseudonocardia hydrocarbonoxydans]GEC20819.1 site-specific integrase [Pseudonocardia hydrocarbonoxydans]